MKLVVVPQERFDWRDMQVKLAVNGSPFLWNKINRKVGWRQCCFCVIVFWKR